MSEAGTGPANQSSNGPAEATLQQLVDRVGRLETMLQQALGLLQTQQGVSLRMFRQVEAERDSYKKSLLALLPPYEFPLSDEELSQLTPGGPTLEDLVQELDKKYRKAQ